MTARFVKEAILFVVTPFKLRKMSHFTKMLLLVAAILGTAEALISSTQLPENQLRKELFKDYDPMVFPEPLDGSKLDLKFRVIIRALDDVDIRKSTATASIVINVYWKNHQLSWNGSQFDSIEQIVTKSTNVWVPNVFHYNSGRSIATKGASPLQIKKDGSCAFSLIATTWGLCKTDITKFPAELHKCWLGFYVHNVYPSNGDHTVSIVQHNNTSINGAWNLKSHQRVNNIFGRLGFDLVLNVTRRPKYLKRKIVTPVLLLSSLTVISYILPVETGERVGFSMTALLTMMLTIQYTMDQLPEMEEEPPVLYYGRLNLFFMITSLLITSIVLNLHHKKRRPMPRVLRRVVSFACRLLWLRDAIHANDVVDLTSNDKGEDNGDWLSAGRVLDRLSFVCFFFITFFILFEIVSFGF